MERFNALVGDFLAGGGVFHDEANARRRRDGATVLGRDSAKFILSGDVSARAYLVTKAAHAGSHGLLLDMQLERPAVALADLGLEGVGVGRHIGALLALRGLQGVDGLVVHGGGRGSAAGALVLVQRVDVRRRIDRSSRAGSDRVRVLPSRLHGPYVAGLRVRQWLSRYRLRGRRGRREVWRGVVGGHGVFGSWGAGVLGVRAHSGAGIAARCKNGAVGNWGRGRARDGWRWCFDRGSRTGGDYEYAAETAWFMVPRRALAFAAGDSTRWARGGGGKWLSSKRGRSHRRGQRLHDAPFLRRQRAEMCGGDGYLNGAPLFAAQQMSGPEGCGLDEQARWGRGGSAVREGPQARQIGQIVKTR